MLMLEARAKINWSLDILGSREDGYHQMDMLMESVMLADRLTILPADTLTLSLEGSINLSMDDNLVLLAARALQQAADIRQGAALRLQKRIPMGAGMGGGSADAAAALIGLNRLWDTRLTLDQLCNIGLRIGADVPFMLVGGLARVGGIGEQIQSLTALDTVHLVILQPCQALSTKVVFTAYDQLVQVRHPMTQHAQSALLRRDLATLSRTAGNVLLAASERKRPQILEAIAALEACNADYAQMTGSGSAVFGAYTRLEVAQQAYRLLRKRWKKCWLTQTAAEGVVFAE